MRNLPCAANRNRRRSSSATRWMAARRWSVAALGPPMPPCRGACLQPRSARGVWSAAWPVRSWRRRCSSTTRLGGWAPRRTAASSSSSSGSSGAAAAAEGAMSPRSSPTAVAHRRGDWRCNPAAVAAACNMGLGLSSVRPGSFDPWAPLAAALADSATHRFTHPHPTSSFQCKQLSTPWMCSCWVLHGRRLGALARHIAQLAWVCTRTRAYPSLPSSLRRCPRRRRLLDGRHLEHAHPCRAAGAGQKLFRVRQHRGSHSGDGHRAHEPDEQALPGSRSGAPVQQPRPENANGGEPLGPDSLLGLRVLGGQGVCVVCCLPGAPGA